MCIRSAHLIHKIYSRQIYALFHYRQAWPIGFFGIVETSDTGCCLRFNTLPSDRALLIFHGLPPVFHGFSGAWMKWRPWGNAYLRWSFWTPWVAITAKKHYNRSESREKRCNFVEIYNTTLSL